MEESANLSARIALVESYGMRVHPTYTNAASGGLVGSSEQAVHCECLHTIPVAEFTKLFETIKM